MNQKLDVRLAVLAEIHAMHVLSFENVTMDLDLLLYWRVDVAWSQLQNFLEIIIF